MKSLRNIIQNRINDGLSLTELIITITISSLLVTSLVGSLLFFQKGFERAERNSDLLRKKAKFFEIISSDVLNPDIYPHHPAEEYSINKNNSIVFFANGGKVTYDFEGGTFTIKRDNSINTNDNTNDSMDEINGIESARKKDDINTFDLLKDFKLKYYDKAGYEIITEDAFPQYCDMYFVFKDNKEIKFRLRL